MSRKVGQVDRLLVASPAYAASRKIPTHPKDLEQWDWLHLSMRPERAELISKSGETASFACKIHVEVDSVYALSEFAIRGVGITPLPEHLANRGIEQGELIRVLPEWSMPPLEFHAVWPDRSRRESLTLIFIRYLANNSEYD